MLSIVEPAPVRSARGKGAAKTVDRRTHLMVRARIAGDIERVFPRAKVIVNGGTDYRFRAFITRKEVGATIGRAAEQINYGNFKSSTKEPARHNAYMRVWSVMDAEQERRYPRPKSKRRVHDVPMGDWWNRGKFETDDDIRERLGLADDDEVPF